MQEHKLTARNLH